MDKTEALLKEYETLRQESLDSMNNRSQVVSFGLGSVGLLAAGVFASDRALQAAGLLVLVFSAAVPIISILVLYVWLGEVERMIRAGRFMVDLEGRINTELDPTTPTLTWEGWLRSAGTQMHYPYIVVIALFLSIAVGSPLVGLVAGGLALQDYWFAVILPWAIVLVVTFHIKSRVSTFR